MTFYLFNVFTIFTETWLYFWSVFEMATIDFWYEYMHTFFILLKNTISQNAPPTLLG